MVFPSEDHAVPVKALPSQQTSLAVPTISKSEKLGVDVQEIKVKARASFDHIFLILRLDIIWM